MESYGTDPSSLEPLNLRLAVCSEAPTVPLLLLQAAYSFMQKHPQVLSSRIAMLGLSFGTSMALKMAVYSNVVKVRV